MQERNNGPDSGPLDPARINDEVAAICARLSSDDCDKAAQREAVRLKKCETRRDALRAGTYRPGCTCSQCVRAVLEMTAPGEYCPSGKSYGW